MDGQKLPLPSAHANMLQVEFAYRQLETRVSIQANTVSILVPSQVRILINFDVHHPDMFRHDLICLVKSSFVLTCS